MSKKQSKITDALMAMKGKTFEYGKLIHYVIDFQIDEPEQKFIIKTNRETFTRNFEAFDDFVSYWQECNKLNPPAVITGDDDGVVHLLQGDYAIADNLVDILMDSITKVKADPGYINQAKAINNQVNSITNIVKMKMDFAKQAKKKRP